MRRTLYLQTNTFVCLFVYRDHSKIYIVSKCVK